MKSQKSVRRNRRIVIFILLIVYLNANSNNHENSKIEDKELQSNYENQHNDMVQEDGVRYKREDDHQGIGKQQTEMQIGSIDTVLNPGSQQRQQQIKVEKNQINNSAEQFFQHQGEENEMKRNNNSQINEETEIIVINDSRKQQTSQNNQQIKQQQQSKDTILKQGSKDSLSQKSEDKQKQKIQQKKPKYQKNNSQNVAKLKQENNGKSNSQQILQIFEPYISIFEQKFSLIFNSFASNFSPQFKHQVENWTTCMIDWASRRLLPLARQFTNLYRILTMHQPPRAKSKKVYYPDNFANLYGGAKIVMKSSGQIKSINSILEDGPDKYMYTTEELPLKIIIGLNEEIAIDSIIIQSYEMYSCITKEFIVEGKFAMEDKKWVYLGAFTALNVFGDQEFFLERKIIRYVKITILSSYGKWSYFTLTQVKIRGKGLFADALNQITQKKSMSSSTNTAHEQSEQSHKQEEEQRSLNICKNQLSPVSQQPHESNMIASLITKLQKLETHNDQQSKSLLSLQQKLLNVTETLLKKTEQNKIYENILSEYRKQLDKNYYALWISLGVSAVMGLVLVCLALFRKWEVQANNKKEAKFEVRKSNSIK